MTTGYSAWDRPCLQATSSTGGAITDCSGRDSVTPAASSVDSPTEVATAGSLPPKGRGQQHRGEMVTELQPRCRQPSVCGTRFALPDSECIESGLELAGVNE